MIKVDDGLSLIPIGVEHAPLLFGIIDVEREYLSEWLPFVENSKEVKVTEAFIQEVIPTDNKQFVIEYQEKIVGIIGFRDTELSNKRTEVGYWLSQYLQGKGVMTRSLKALLEYAFTELEINRVQLRAASGNTKSRNIAERLGFTNEGIQREGELMSSGVFVDLVVYSMLKNEFQK